MPSSHWSNGPMHKRSLHPKVRSRPSCGRSQMVICRKEVSMLDTSSSWRRLRALVQKEGIQIIHDPSSILIAFVLPVLLLFLYGYAVSLDSTKIKLGFVLEDRSPEVESLLAAFRDSKYFLVTVSQSRRELEDDLVAGRIRGLVVVPVDFSRKRCWGAGNDSPVQVVADGSEPTTANFVQNYTAGVVGLWLRQRAFET